LGIRTTPVVLRSCRQRHCAQSSPRGQAVPALPTTPNGRAATTTVAGAYGAYRNGRADPLPPAVRATRPGPGRSDARQAAPRRTPQAARPRPGAPGRSLRDSCVW
jgi:hypothetical protein